MTAKRKTKRRRNPALGRPQNLPRRRGAGTYERPSLEQVMEVARWREEQSAEIPTEALLLLEDPSAVRVAIAWSNYGVDWQFPEDGIHVPPGRTVAWRPKRLIGWAWRGVDVDWRRLADAAGLPLATAKIRHAMLAANLLIYPDGSLHAGAAAILRRRMFRRLYARTAPRSRIPPSPDAGKSRS